MAEPLLEKGKVSEKEQEYYNAFRKWVTTKYGWWKLFSEPSLTIQRYKTSPYYTEWVKEGYPGWTTPTPEEIAEVEAEAAKEAEAEKLPPKLGEVKPIGDDWYVFKDGKWQQTTPPEGSTPVSPTGITPTPATTQRGYPAEVVSEGGYSFQIWRDASGKAVDKVMMGLTPTPAKKDWAPETLALGREKFAWTKSQSEAELARQPELQRQRNELQFEKDRNDLINGLPANDWVRRFFVENQPNPYRAQDTTATSFADLERGLDERTADVQYRQQILSNAIMGGANEDTIAKLKDLRDQASAKRDVYYDAWNKQKTEQRDWTSQIYPNAPDWLPYYVPGVTAGKMITPQEVPIPSGQQLTAMPTNMLESLASYSKWAGGQMWRPLSDEVRRIRESAALMQPETPRGAGGFRTSPTRQWM